MQFRRRVPGLRAGSLLPGEGSRPGGGQSERADRGIAGGRSAGLHSRLQRPDPNPDPMAGQTGHEEHPMRPDFSKIDYRLRPQDSDPAGPPEGSLAGSRFWKTPEHIPVKAWDTAADLYAMERSGERRVGKAGRSARAPHH